MTCVRSVGLVSCLFGLACAGVKQGVTSPGGGGNTGSANTSGGGGTGAVSGTPCVGVCMDFPTAPIMEGSAPGNSMQIFGAPGTGSGGGPCLFEPQDGSLFPNNWLRPRFRFAVPANQGLYEIRVHAPNQANDLVVYTTNNVYTMRKDIWQNLASHTRDMGITVTVRSAPLAGGTVLLGSQTSFTIAPAAASGKMVYWSTSGSTNGVPTGSETFLSGFAVGDESVVQVLTPAQVANYTPTASSWKTVDQGGTNTRPVQCIGCHTSTPDGAFISFNDFYPWGAVIVSGAAGMQGAPPNFVLAGGRTAVIQPWVGITTYSKGHWTTGDHIMVAPLGTNTANDGSADTDQRPGLAWFDLESAASGNVAAIKGSAWNWIYQPLSGQYAAAPSWSHDGNTVLFTMTSKVVSGRLGTGTAHLYTVPYSKTAVQTPTQVAGAGMDTTVAQYYGTYSGDDKLIAFNQIPAGTAASTHPQMDGSSTPWDGMYAQPATEIHVMRADGSSVKRLDANSPATCPGQPASPGINNSWPKWSPSPGVMGANGRTYYWLIFSSWREGAHYPNGAPIAQLYVTAVAMDEINIYTYPAIYLWNQPANFSNHTPAWDIFQIPDVM